MVWNMVLTYLHQLDPGDLPLTMPKPLIFGALVNAETFPAVAMRLRAETGTDLLGLAREGVFWNAEKSRWILQCEAS